MKKTFTRIGLITLLCFCLSVMSKAQISLTSTGGTSTAAVYTTLKAAFDKINDGTTHTGDITILVTGNTTETASATLGKTGVYISPFGTPNYTSVSISPTAASGGRTISGNIAGPIVWLQGSDNVTIDGINTGSGASTQSLTFTNTYVGVAPYSSYWTTLTLSYTASNNTIKNCTFLGSAQMSGVVYCDGSQSNLLFKKCTIGAAGSNIPVRGIQASGDNITIDSCRISDFGSIGIDFGGVTNSVVTNNRVDKLTSTTAPGSMYGIMVNGITTVTNNAIGGSGTFAVTTAGGFSAIYSGFSSPATATGTVNISNNTISNISITSSNNSSSFAGINNNWSGDAPNVTLNVSNNTIRNITLLTTQSDFYGILWNWYKANNTTVSGNIIHNISRNTAGGTSDIIGLYGNAYNASVINNTIYNLGTTASTTNSLSGIEYYYPVASSASSTTLIQNNTVYGFTGQAYMRGIYCNASTVDLTGLTIDVNSNKVYNLNSTSSTGGVSGIGMYSKKAAAINVYKNKVHSLSGYTVLGIVNEGNITNTYNNYIGFTNATTTGIIIYGLRVSGPLLTADVTVGDNYAVYNNTIFINGVTSTATNFSLVGVYAQSEKNNGLLIQNNLVMNVGVPKGTGKAVAFQWANSGYPITNISAASNNNSFYAGIPSSTHLIYSDGNVVNDKQTLAAYQTYMAPRETNSITEGYVSNFSNYADGTLPNYLHITDGSITKLESGGINQVLFTDDYDGDVRPGPISPVYGGSTSFDIGADEFDGIRPTCTTPTPGNTISSVTAVCYGGSAALSLQNSLAGTGYVYQWQSSPDGSVYNNIEGANATTFNATNITTDGYFRCYITCYNSPNTTGISTPVQITIHKISSTTPGSRCGTGTVTLAATGVTGTINWYSSLTGGASLGTGGSFTTPSISTTTTYYVDITNTTLGCTSGPRVEVIATINTLPTIASTTPGSRCGTGTVTLSASSSDMMAFLSWYNASTGGSLVGSGNSFTTPSISATTTYYVQATNMMGCASSPRTAVTATIYNPTVTGTTPASRCNPGSIAISATGSAGSTLKWYAASTGGTALYTGASYFIPFLSATTTYYVEASESTCASARTAVTATINTTVTPSVNLASGSGTSICAGSSVTFTATPTNGGSAPTYNFRKNGTSVQNSSSNTYTTSSLVNGDVITCIITANNPCQTTPTALSNAITMTVSTAVTPSVSITSNPASGMICGSGSSVSFTATPVNGGGSPTYNFKLNGASVQNSSSAVYTTISLANGDAITCEMTANNTCQTIATVISNAITITYGPPVPGVDGYTIINTAADIEIANAECTGPDGWTTYYNTVNKKIILTIKKNGNNIGTIGDPGFQVESGTTANYGSNTGTSIMAPYVTQPNWYVMNRYWKVTTNSQPLSDVNVRTYYTTQDISDVQGSVPSATEATIYFFKINGGGDPNPANGHIGIAAANVYNATGYWEYSKAATSNTTEWEVGSVTGGRYAEYTIASFSGGGGGASPAGGAIGSALPIHLLSFTAQLENDNNTKLQWKLAQPEADGKYYLQHSTDSRNYNTINIQTGDAFETEFNYTDHNIANGSHYYRLKMIDANNQTTYSNIAVIKVGDKTQRITIYPNPVQKGSSIQIGLQNVIANKIELINPSGQVVYSSMGRLTGSISVSVSAAVNAGLYVLRLYCENDVKTMKVMVY